MTSAEEKTHTDGKHCFQDLYNDPDAAPYMLEMAHVGYVIADHSSRIALSAMRTLLATSSLGEPGTDEPPVVLELCSGYGLSLAPILTTLSIHDVLEHFVGVRPPLEEALEQDGAFFDAAARPDLPRITAVGVDVAENALAYGSATGIFSETICRNLEASDDDEEEQLTAREERLCARARLVLATGAFSYVTTKTLRRLCHCWRDEAQKPLFLFFPLVATDMLEIISFLRSDGLEVYYEPGLHWLPQRRFADDGEAAAITAAQDAVLAASGRDESPPGALEGHLHATPLIAGPAGCDLAARARLWLRA